MYCVSTAVAIFLLGGGFKTAVWQKSCTGKLHFRRELNYSGSSLRSQCTARTVINTNNTPEFADHRLSKLIKEKFFGGGGGGLFDSKKRQCSLVSAPLAVGSLFLFLSKKHCPDMREVGNEMRKSKKKSIIIKSNFI